MELDNTLQSFPKPFFKSFVTYRIRLIHLRNTTFKLRMTLKGFSKPWPKTTSVCGTGSPPNKLFNLCSGQAIRSSISLLRSAAGCLISKWFRSSDLLNFQGYTYSVVVIHLDMRGNFNKTSTETNKETKTHPPHRQQNKNSRHHHTEWS